MNSFIEYLMQSGIILGLFYVGYSFFLKNETGFLQNRVFLLFGVLAAALVPAFPITVSVQQQPAGAVWLTEVVVQPEGFVSAVATGMSSSRLLLLIYLSGVFVFSVRLITQVLKILSLIKRHKIVKSDDDYIVFLAGDYAPFSILNLIFVNAATEKNSLGEIIAHERVHIRQKHSFDLLLIEILTVIHWFNPFIWLIKKAVKNNHEYLADEGVIKQGHNRHHYQDLLLSQVFGMQINFLTNNFNHSLIKRRLTMMSKIKNSKRWVWKFTFLVPVTLAMALFIALTFNTRALAQDKQTTVQMQKSKQAQATAPQNEKSKQEVPVFTVVEEMPTYKGGKEALLEYLSTNIKYPDEAKKNGIEGRSFVTFVIEKDGQVSNVSLLRGFNDACDNEAVRVVKSMPAWNPGKQRGETVRVQFNLPIHFRLDGKKAEEQKG